MKTPMILSLLFTFLLVEPFYAQEMLAEDSSVPEASTRILNKLPDGTPPLPAPPVELPDFRVKRAVVKSMMVTEPPPMMGLPPVEGRIKITTRLVEDPKLPEPVVVPPPPARERTAEEIAALKERNARYLNPHFVSLTATVFDQKRTLLEWRFRPDTEAQAGMDELKTYSAWSNVNFSYFRYFTDYQVVQEDGTPRRYQLMMYVMPRDTAREQRLSAHFNRIYQQPVIPELPDVEIAGPQFIVTGDDAGSEEALRFFQGLHDLYQVEGERMKNSYFAMKKLEDEQRAYFLAHPPKPKNLVVNYWLGKRPEPQAQEGSQP